MSCLCRVAGYTLLDRVRSSVIREEVKVESLLLHIERSQLKWYRHLIRMPPGRLLVGITRHSLLGRDPGVVLRLAGGIISPSWPGSSLGSAGMKVAGGRVVWDSLFSQLLLRPYLD